MAVSPPELGGGDKGRKSLTPYGFVFLFGLLGSFALVLWKQWSATTFVAIFVVLLVGGTFYFDETVDGKMRELRHTNEKRFSRICVANKICTYIGYVLFFIGAVWIVMNT